MSSSSLRAAVEEFLTSQRENNGPLTVQGLDRLIHRLADRAHIEDAFIHKFRHTFAVNYLLAGGVLYKLMRLLGHSDIKTTQVYLRPIDQKQARGALSVLDNINL